MMGLPDTAPTDAEGPEPVALPGRQAAIAGRASRLGHLVRAAGGTEAVAALSGIPEGTLKRYIAGRDMPVSALVALARAMDADLEWLAIGNRRDRRRKEFTVPPAEAGSGVAAGGMSWRGADPDAAVGLAWSVHPDRIARAYEMALKGLVSVPDGPPDPRRLMQITLLLYDELTEAEQAASKPRPG